MAPWWDFNATVPITEVNTNGQLFTKTAAEAPVLIKQWRCCLPGQRVTNYYFNQIQIIFRIWLKKNPQNQKGMCGIGLLDKA